MDDAIIFTLDASNNMISIAIELKEVKTKALVVLNTKR